MRQIVLDTETTGLDPRAERVIEIGCVELLSRKPSGRTYHVYLNPEKEIDAGAIAVHGLTNDFLADKPLFAQVAAEFMDFIQGAELVIHNAPFDVGFLNAEFARLGAGTVGCLCGGVLDTLKLAKEMHPGKRNSLDALCDRYEVDNSGREFHGALLDAQLLADVYLAMTRGQESLIIDLEPEPAARPGREEDGALPELPRTALRVLRATEEELAAHEAILAAIHKDSKGKCIWLADAAASSV